MPVNIDIFLNKKQSVKRCLSRIREHYDGSLASLENLDHQDIIILNLQRACEAALDYGNHLIAVHNYPIAQSAKDIFRILEAEKIIPKELSDELQRMTGFRNLAVHQYQDLNLEILKAILDNHLTCLLDLFDIDVS